MLVLSSKRHENVWLHLPGGQRIQVCAVDIRGDKVRLGFEAPADVRIYRGGVCDDRGTPFRQQFDSDSPPEAAQPMEEPQLVA